RWVAHDRSRQLFTRCLDQDRDDGSHGRFRLAEQGASALYLLRSECNRAAVASIRWLTKSSECAGGEWHGRRHCDNAGNLSVRADRDGSEWEGQGTISS